MNPEIDGTGSALQPEAGIAILASKAFLCSGGLDNDDLERLL